MEVMEVDSATSEDELNLVGNSAQEHTPPAVPTPSSHRKPHLATFSVTSNGQSRTPQHPLAISHTAEPAIPQWETISTTSSRAPGPKKPRAKPPTDRTPGHTLLSLNKVDSIVHADPENRALSKEALFMVAVATEEFIKRFSKTAHTRADVDQRSLVQYRDVAATAFHFEEFQFLQDTIPQPMSLSKALAMREAKLKQQRENDPNAMPLSSAPDSKDDTQPISSVSKGKARARAKDVDTGAISVEISTKDPNAKKKATPSTSEVKVNGTSAMPPPSTKPERPVRERKPKTPSAAGFVPLTERDGVERPSPDVAESVSTGGASGSRDQKATSVGPNRIRIRRPRTSGSPYPSPHPQPNGEANTNSTVSEEDLENTAQSSKRTKSKATTNNSGETGRSGRSSKRENLKAITETSEARVKSKAHSSDIPIRNSDNVTFAPVGATEAPLWSRKPLPPYGSVQNNPSPVEPIERMTLKIGTSKGGGGVRQRAEDEVEEHRPHGPGGQTEQAQPQSPLSPLTPTAQHQSDPLASSNHSPSHHSHTHQAHNHSPTHSRHHHYHHHSHYPSHVHAQSPSDSGSTHEPNPSPRVQRTNDLRSAFLASPTAGRTIYSRR